MRPLDRLSLRWRIPGIIALILISAVAVLIALAYGAARRSAVELSRERLRSAAVRVAEATGTGVSGLVGRLEAVADTSLVIEALRHPEQPLSDQVQSALQGSATGSVEPIRVALIDRHGVPLTGDAPSAGLDIETGRYPMPDRTTLSPFYERGGKLAYTIAAPVHDSGKVIGQIRQWRQVSRVTAAFVLLSNLIGDSATLLIGNTDGTMLTELADTSQPPVIRDSARVRLAMETHVSAAAPIAGTPWSFTVEFPVDFVLGPLGVLSWQSAAIILTVILLAMLAGDLLSRGVTRPITRLTHAAEAIAGGDLTHRPVALERRDELGRLSRSFGVMADSVRDSHDQLERRIEERTVELQRAMKTLRDTQDELVRQEKFAMLGQLSSSVGHELRNPLGVMANAVYILDKVMVSPPPKVQECLRMLRSQIHLSERIVTDLLDSVRGKAPVRQRVDVDVLIRNQVARVTVPSAIAMRVAIDRGLPSLHVDPDQVGQILVNLVTNAVQAIDGQSGSVSVRARNGRGRIRIEVRDSGPGVPDELQERIFEPLFTTKARGIGLGLAVSRSLAEANSGALSVMNHSEGGAVFMLDLPIGEPQ